MVGFVSVGGGIGAVSWFALGPHEAYIPAYRSSYGYIRNVNVHHVAVSHSSDIAALQNRNVYVNRTVPGAIAQVPRTVLQNGQPVFRNRMPFAPNAVVGGPVGAAPGFSPRSAGPYGGAPEGARPPAHAFGQGVVSRQRPFVVPTGRVGGVVPRPQQQMRPRTPFVVPRPAPGADGQARPGGYAPGGGAQGRPLPFVAPRFAPAPPQGRPAPVVIPRAAPGGFAPRGPAPSRPMPAPRSVVVPRPAPGGGAGIGGGGRFSPGPRR